MTTETGNAESYVVGIELARNFRRFGLDLDARSIMQGVADGLSGSRPAYEEKDIRRIRHAFRNQMMHKVAASEAALALENRRRAEEFLEANGREEGVATLRSGVQYRVLHAGTGRMPTDADTVRCHYRGSLLDGTEFDGTHGGEPATLKVAQLIAGWREVLKSMPEGSRWQVFIPPQHAYGERGVGSEIGPNALLSLDLDLIAVI